MVRKIAFNTLKGCQRYYHQEVFHLYQILYQIKSLVRSKPDVKSQGRCPKVHRKWLYVCTHTIRTMQSDISYKAEVLGQKNVTIYEE